MNKYLLPCPPTLHKIIYGKKKKKRKIIWICFKQWGKKMRILTYCPCHLNIYSSHKQSQMLIKNPSSLELVNMRCLWFGLSLTVLHCNNSDAITIASTFCIINLTSTNNKVLWVPTVIIPWTDMQPRVFCI